MISGAIAGLVVQAMLGFMTVAQGTASQIFESQDVVIRSAEEWQALWKRHSPHAPAPPVDFSQSLIVGVFLGSRPTAGFRGTIIAVKREAGVVVVEYVEHRPAPGALVAQVLTSPFHLVSLPRDVGMIQFRQVEPPA